MQSDKRFQSDFQYTVKSFVKNKSNFRRASVSVTANDHDNLSYQFNFLIYQPQVSCCLWLLKFILILLGWAILWCVFWSWAGGGNALSSYSFCHPQLGLSVKYTDWLGIAHSVMMAAGVVCKQQQLFFLTFKHHSIGEIKNNK